MTGEEPDDKTDSLIRPDQVRTRIQLWAEEAVRLGDLPLKAGVALDALLYRGLVPRVDIAGVFFSIVDHA